MTRETIIRVAAVLLACTLFGCGGNLFGGGGGGGANDFLPTGRVSGHVVLPPGMGAPWSSVRVATVQDSVAVSDAGAFSIHTFTGGPTPVMVFVDNVLTLYGYVGDGYGTIDARSTAEYLAYFALGAYLTPPEMRETIVADLHSDPLLDPLAAIIGDALAADPGAIATPDPDIQAALQSACEAISNEPGTRGVLINPGEGRSGTAVQHKDLNTVQIVNYRRRRALAFVDQVSYTTPGEPPITHDAPQAITEVKVSPTVGVTSVTGALSSLIKGEAAYSPVYSDPIAVPVRPEEALRTRYQVTVIGVGFLPGAISTLPPERKSRYRSLALSTLTFDVFLPLLLNTIIPANKDRFETMLGGAEQLSAAQAVLTFIGELPDVAAWLEPNSPPVPLSEVAYALMQKIVTSDEFRQLCLSMIQGLMDKFHIEIRDGGDLQTGFKNISAMLKGVNMVLQALDSSAQAADIVRSEQAVVIDVTANRSRVVLSPDAALIGPQAQAEFVATVPDAGGTSATLKYHWVGTGQAGELHDGIHTGNDFESSRSTVTFSPFGTLDRSDTITVEVLEFVENSWRSLGDARAQVTVRDARAALTPTVVSLRPGESMELRGFVTPAPPAGEMFEYHWHTHGSAGSFNGVLDKVGSSSVTYVAGSAPGTDRVTVEIFRIDRAQRLSLGTKTADVLVELEPSYVYGTVRTVGEVTGGVGGWASWVQTFVEFPDVPGATSYTATSLDVLSWSEVSYFGPPFDASHTSPGMHGFVLTGGAGWGWGEPPDQGQMIANAEEYARWRYPGAWAVRVPR